MMRTKTVSASFLFHDDKTIEKALQKRKWQRNSTRAREVRRGEQAPHQMDFYSVEVARAN